MKQSMTGAPAREPSWSHPRAPAATVTDVMRPPLTTVSQYDHVAAAAYLMKHAGTTALMVVNARTGQPAGIITQADVARAVVDGKDLNEVRVYAVMANRPAIVTTTSIRAAANIMTARHFRHLPVTDDAGLLGLIDITDVCRVLASVAAGPGHRAAPGAGRPARRHDHAGTSRPCPGPSVTPAPGESR